MTKLRHVSANEIEPFLKNGTYTELEFGNPPILSGIITPTPAHTAENLPSYEWFETRFGGYWEEIPAEQLVQRIAEAKEWCDQESARHSTGG